MSQKHNNNNSNKQHQTTTLQNVTEWLKAVQAAHPDHIQHVTDDAVVGLQTLHTAVVQHVMERAVALHEETLVATNGKKKRKVEDIMNQVHAEMGLTKEWIHAQEAIAAAAQVEEEVEASAKPLASKKMSKAQRRRARKLQAVDPKMLQEQEEMLRKTRERMLQQKQKEDAA